MTFENFWPVYEKKKALHVDLRNLYLEAMQDCIEKHRKAMVKEICDKVLSLAPSSSGGWLSDNSPYCLATVKGINIVAAGGRGYDWSFIASEPNAGGRLRFYASTRLDDVVYIYNKICNGDE